MYDILFVGNDEKQFKQLSKCYPNSQWVTFNDFDDLKKQSFTKHFWLVHDDYNIVETFNLNSYKIDKWDSQYHHVFLNDNEYDGLVLLNKTLTVSTKELKHRFYTNQKKIEKKVSLPKKFDIFSVKNYDDYLEIYNQVDKDLFWIVFDDLTVVEDFDFSFYIPHHNFADRKQNHIFLNDNVFDGIILASRYKKISKKEFEYRFLISKKEINIKASIPNPFDIVFISYEEPNAEDNYKDLQQRFPNVKRVHGVKGIHQAHIAAAKLCDTKMFWVVDGDAKIVENFNFNYQVAAWDKNVVHVWRSKNPINDLVYGYGGIKLLPRDLTINMDTSKPDMTTSISSKFKPVNEISNITEFNTDPFNTWKSAFRECAKLASKTIQGQIDEETEQRLQAWTTQGRERRFGDTAIRGARLGSVFGSTNRNNPAELALINDFDWLKQEFIKSEVNEQ